MISYKNREASMYSGNTSKFNAKNDRNQAKDKKDM